MTRLIMKVLLWITAAFMVVPSLVAQQESSGWRGPHRDGIYPEQDLLTQWPAGGPKLLWKYDNLCSGFASAAVTSDRVYTIGTVDSISYIFRFNTAGSLIWKKMLGPDWKGEYPGTYSTPAISDGLGYIVNGLGVIFCFNALNGDIVWTRNLVKDFNGLDADQGFLDNLIVDGEVVYCAPGGAQKNIVALNRKTGKMVWESTGSDEISICCSPILIETGGKKFYVYQAAKSIISLNTATGAIAWKKERRNQISPNTPIFRDNYLYALAGDGCETLKISNDGLSSSECWENAELCSFMGDAVVLNDRIYGKGKDQKFVCVDWKTGRTLYSLSLPAMVITIISSEGLLYCYDYDGTFSLIKPNEDRFQTVGTFKVKGGTKSHCSHPVIRDGRLYIRHDNSLFVYNISKMELKQTGVTASELGVD
jgi:outer membrane protein assembly factor BamB